MCTYPASNVSGLVANEAKFVFKFLGAHTKWPSWAPDPGNGPNSTNRINLWWARPYSYGV